MELEYVLRAMRRFWAVVLFWTVVGLLGALLVVPTPAPEYTADALLQVRPADSSDFGTTASDRYVSSQLVILQTRSMTAEVAELAEIDWSLAAIEEAVTFSQITDTDAVRITAVASSPNEAAAIANGYVDAYVELADSRVGTTIDAEREQLDRTIANVEEQLTIINERIDEALRVTRDAAPGDEDTEPPTLGDIAPELVTARQVTLEQYGQLLLRRVTLDSQTQQEPDEVVIQRADVPTQPTTGSNRLTSVGFAAASILLGVGVAVVLARTSQRVLDTQEVTETLGVPFAGVMTKSSELESKPLTDMDAVPADFAAMIDSLSVRAEALGSPGRALTVLVTGAQRNAGTSTLATCLAARFGRRGAVVTLVDLDLDHPTVSQDFGVRGDGFARLLSHDGLPQQDRGMRVPSPAGLLIERMADEAASGRRIRLSREPHPIGHTSTALDNVAVVGRELDTGGIRPHRVNLETVIDLLTEFADIVVIDAGPMLAESAGAKLAHRADAIVLTVPVRRLRRSQLVAIARHLSPLQAKLLPVKVPTLKHAPPPEKETAHPLVPNGRHSGERARRPEDRTGTIA